MIDQEMVKTLLSAISQQTLVMQLALNAKMCNCS